MRKYVNNKVNINRFADSVRSSLAMVNGESYETLEGKGSKIGIIELYHANFDHNYVTFFEKGINLQESESREKREGPEHHSTTVSLIAGSKHGVDKTSNVYLSTVSTDGEWNKYLEKMVKEDEVKIINHSYTFGQIKYTEQAYFLDFLARKYGVIHVIAAGNESKKPGKHNHIGDIQLSLNSVVVAASSEDATKENIISSGVASYSNYKLLNEYKDFAKPLVTAPSTFYEIAYNKNEIGTGTSYAAPFVAGIISNLLKIKPTIANSEHRVPIIKSVLSASAIRPKVRNTYYKNSGYERKFGAGTVDFEGMKQAANNYKIVSVSPSSQRDFVLSSDSITLEAGQEIQFAASWMFNAGLLKTKESRPKYTPKNNWWNSFLNFFSWSRKQAEHEAELARVEREGKIWDATHNNEWQLNQQTAKELQYNRWFSHYNLRLERLNDYGRWELVVNLRVQNSNDKLFTYKTANRGIYRYRVYKNSVDKSTNSVNDLIAATHVVRDENN